MNVEDSQLSNVVLVVDDQSTARAILRELLASMGYGVVEAADGAQAMRLLDEHRFCLVTLDMIIPSGSGLEVLRHARARYSYAELPVLVISVKDESQDIVEALSLGANDYVTKPIDHDVLRARIRTHMSRWEAETELRRTYENLETRVATRTTDLQRTNRALRVEIDERRKVEEALHKFAQMVNSASDMLTFMDRNYRYVAVNESFLSTFELDTEAVIGHSMEQLFGETFFRQELKPQMDLSLDGVRVATQIRIELPHKGTRYLDIRYDPHREPDGAVSGVVVNARDVTDHQLAENALHALARSTAKDTESFVRTCIRALIDTYGVRYAYVCTLDPESSTANTLASWANGDFADKAAYPLAGAPCAEVIGAGTLFVHDGFAAQYPDFIDLTGWNVDSYFAQVLRSQDGTPLGVVAVADSQPVHITTWSSSILETVAARIALELERSRAVQASEHSLALQRAALESIGSGILVVDLERRVLSYNQQLLDMWHIPAERMEQFSNDHRKLVELVATQLTEPERYLAEAEANYANIGARALDTLHFKDGRIFERYSQPYRLGGEVVGRALNFTDITERVTAERQLEEYKNNLEELVQSRTAELEAMNNEIASFSYSVSHDLRAPLRSIDGFSKLMLEDYGRELDDNALVYLDRIRNASQRMGELIDDVLLLSRLSRRELAVRHINLAEIGSEVARKLKESEPERRVEFVIPATLQAMGDAHLLRMLLENLLGNAWKYSRKQTTARIELGAQNEPGETPVYFVSDNGVGFDMKYVEKLFQPFQRLHSVTEFEGTGIGLATVAQIVRRHRGEVWAEGRLNVGATVFFTLNEIAGDSGLPRGENTERNENAD